MSNQQGKGGGAPPSDDRTILDPLNADELKALREAKEKFQRAQSEGSRRGLGPDAGDDIGDAPTRALGALPTFDRPGPSLQSLQSNSGTPRIIAEPKPLTPESARIATGTVGAPNAQRPSPGGPPAPHGPQAPGPGAPQTPGFGENTLMWMQPVRVEQPQPQVVQIPGQNVSIPTIVPSEPRSKRNARTALGVVVLLVIGLLLYFLLAAGGKKTVVEIVTVPDKAEVELDGRKMQYQTNIKATLEAGSHQITLKKEGFKPETFTLEIPEGGQPEGAPPLRKQIDLTPVSQPGKLTVSIEVGPVAANITVNGVAMGSKRSVKVADLDPQKTNKIVVEAGGYAKMETEIPAGQLKDSYNFLLQQEPKSP